MTSEVSLCHKVIIRRAVAVDANELLKIYTPYVRDTAITFECDVPSVSEFADRIEEISKKYPYIVAIEDEHIIGYAYASAFKERAAYAWAVEMTVYLKPECQGKGVGKKLYLTLEDLLQRQNVINLNACIAYTREQDAHLDNSSRAFHHKLGYKKVAHFTKCGYKFGTWYDMIWMEKMLGEHPDQPKPFITTAEIDAQ
ncbi:N-acetyltransferase family protein [Eubacteriaceae bacterium ES2]|nr:N-acetyltransferase family protein [Eubacteriaceae bacterium ES2]